MGKGHNKHKRRSNTKLQARRATSWGRNSIAKQERAREQAAAFQQNKKTVIAGDLTPWQAAIAARRAKRAAKAAEFKHRKQEGILSAS